MWPNEEVVASCVNGCPDERHRGRGREQRAGRPADDPRGRRPRGAGVPAPAGRAGLHLRAGLSSALDARQFEDTAVIARTDACESADADRAEPVERGRAFADAGVGLGGRRSPTPPARTPSAAPSSSTRPPGARLAFACSSSFAWSEEADPLTFRGPGELDHECTFITPYALRSSAHAVYEGTKAIAERGEAAQFDLRGRNLDHGTESHHELSLVSRFRDVEARSDPDARDRMENSEGSPGTDRLRLVGRRRLTSVRPGRDRSPTPKPLISPRTFEA